MIRARVIFREKHFIRPERFGWKPGGDIAPVLRRMFEYCKNSRTCKEIRLSFDPSSPGTVPGAYRAWSGANTNRCVSITGPAYNGIHLLGHDRLTTRIEYDHARGLTSRGILSWLNSNVYIEGLTADGREQDRLPVPGLTLTDGISASDTTIAITGGSAGLQGIGTFKIEDEWIAYDAKSGNDAVSCTRGIRGTTATSHSAGAVVFHQLMTGHHPVAINEFQSATIRDSGIENAVGYGLGVENSGTQTIENLDLDGLWFENIASDAMDIKCPVANGNKYSRIRNVTAKGWSRETSWGSRGAESAFDCRIQSAHITDLTLIYTGYMGGATGLSLRPNQAGDYSGGHFSEVKGVQLLGHTGAFGTKVPNHNGIVVSANRTITTNVVARDLTGVALFVAPGEESDDVDGCIIDDLQADRCLRGVQLLGSNNLVQNSIITNSLAEGILDSRVTGIANDVINTRVYDSATYGVRTSANGSIRLLDVIAERSGVQDYLLNPNCTVQKTAGAIRTVTADYVATQEDYTILVDASGGPRTVELPHVWQVAPRREFIVKKVDDSSNAVIIDPVGSTQIENAATKSLTAQWETARITNDASEWFQT